MIEVNLIDLIESAVYVLLGMVVIYLTYQLLRTEKQVRENDAKLAPYKVPAPVATAPVGRKRVPAKKVVAKKTTPKRKPK